MLGQSNGSTATGSFGFHGPGSSDDSRNTRHRLVLSQVLKMNKHEVPSYSCLPLWHLTCVFLVFLVKGHLSSQHGHPFASPLFRRLAGRGALFRGFPFRWVLHFVLSLTRSVIVHDAASCSREDSLSCLCFTALWLANPNLCVQEILPAKDINLTCFKTFPIKATTCLQFGPTSLDWPLDPIARFDLSGPSSSPEDPNDEQERGAPPASTRSRWRQDALQPPQILRGIAGRDTCGHFPDGGLHCITWNTRGHVGSFFPRRRTESSNSHISGSSLTTTTSCVSRRCMERTSISRLFRCWLRSLGFLLPSFLETKMQGDRQYSFTRIFCLKDALVTHMITCQGRDHFVNVQYGRQILVIVNVHFEPELTLRQLRERLRLSIRIGLRIPTLWASSLVMSTSVNQKKEGSTYGTKPSPTVTGERPPCFIPFFHMSSRLLNLATRGGTPQPLGSCALYQGLIAFLWARCRGPSEDVCISWCTNGGLDRWQK